MSNFRVLCLTDSDSFQKLKEALEAISFLVEKVENEFQVLEVFRKGKAFALLLDHDSLNKSVPILANELRR